MPASVERLVEQRAGGADEGMAAQVFFVAGLLADEHHRRRRLALAEDGLRGVLPEVAGRAAGGGGLQFSDGGGRGGISMSLTTPARVQSMIPPR